eukprot:CAMPEP_0179865408 /NCGR_PEP_ID=MMETSP0982-20121206/16813_1 /TAXON_ID=483367 /ORGANISM="non described non described, Strain CCMP 2436" /LENGTH=150 /DNA_ID=CAMNT_0021754083 /DNA_START=45 /DNA_END=497 /DNA_ORIENTATION=-
MPWRTSLGGVSNGSTPVRSDTSLGGVSNGPTPVRSDSQSDAAADTQIADMEIADTGNADAWNADTKVAVSLAFIYGALSSSAWASKHAFCSIDNHRSYSPPVSAASEYVPKFPPVTNESNERSRMPPPSGLSSSPCPTETRPFKNSTEKE